MKVKVSIIIPIYNVEKYLDECMLSAVNQTLDDVEIIAIDDKSTDSSLAILKRYKEKYNFIKVFENEENLGVSETRNIGINNAKGEYVYFLDSDDYISLEAMKISYDKAKEYDVDIITFDAEMFRDKDYTQGDLNENYERDKIIKSECLSGEAFFNKYYPLGAYKSTVWINMYKREFLIKNNLTFYKGIIGEDELHSFKTYLLAKKISYIPQKLIFRRVRNNSLMTSSTYKQRFDSTEVVVQEMYKFYIDNEYRFNIKTVQNIKRYIKFIFDIAIIFCERGKLIKEKARLIDNFEVSEVDNNSELIIKNTEKSKLDSKKDILFVMYLLLDGGAEKFLMSILDNLDYSKYNVDLVVLGKEKSYLYDINKNVNVIYLYENVNEMYEDYSNGKFNLKFEKKYDIEIGFLGIFTTWIIARFGNPDAKKITWLHGDFSLMVLGNSVEYVNDLYGRMDNIIAVSDGVKKSFVHFAGNQLENNIKVIYSPIDVLLIRELSLEDIRYKKNKLTVMSIGRLSSEKGFDRLINIHRKLIDDGVDHEFLILGSGGEEANLERLIKDLRVEDSCKLIEYQKNPYSWIRICDVFVSASHSEALGLAIIEGMVLGRPIVATDTHGSRALFKDNLGLMVGNSEEGLYYGIRSMLLNKELRELYMKNLNEVSKFDFDKDTVMVQLENLFDGGKI